MTIPKKVEYFSAPRLGDVAIDFGGAEFEKNIGNNPVFIFNSLCF